MSPAITCEIPISGNPHVRFQDLPSAITCEIPVSENPHVRIRDMPPAITCEIPISENPHVRFRDMSPAITCGISISENPHVRFRDVPPAITCEITVFENPHVIPGSPLQSRPSTIKKEAVPISFRDSSPSIFILNRASGRLVTADLSATQLQPPNRQPNHSRSADHPISRSLHPYPRFRNALPYHPS